MTGVHQRRRLAKEKATMTSLDTEKEVFRGDEPTVLPALKATPDQIDNLLRFINRAETADDLSCAFAGELGERIGEVGQKILDIRDVGGGFFGTESLVVLEQVVGKDLPALLTAARYPLLSTPPTERFVALSFTESPLLVSGFIGVPILFAIAWAKEPPGWAVFIRFGIALADKRLGLSLEESALEKRLKKAQERIGEAEADRAASMAMTPRDQQVIDQSNQVIDANRARETNFKSDLATCDAKLRPSTIRSPKRIWTPLARSSRPTSTNGPPSSMHWPTEPGDAPRKRLAEVTGPRRQRPRTTCSAISTSSETSAKTSPQSAANSVERATRGSTRIAAAS